MIRNSTIYNNLRRVKYFILRNMMKIFWIFPIDCQKVVCSNFNGKGFGDNPKYISRELSKKGSMKIYWLTADNTQSYPEYITPIKYKSLISIYHLATAKVWIDNNRKEPYISKRKKQVYLQTWHGSIALKKIEKDAESSLNDFYISNAKRDSKMINLMISNSSFADNMFGKSFWYDGKIIKSGSPRLDILFDHDIEKSIRKQLRIKEESFVILYAPTFRNSQRLDVYDINVEWVKKAFEALGHEHVVFLFRVHPNLLNRIEIDKWNGVIDVSQYADVYELLAISDVLITDYSSLMFEFPTAIAKPVFCYAKDIEEYDRGFYFNLDDLPFSVSKSNEELVMSIKNFDKKKYKHKLDLFYSGIGLKEDGHASERIAEILIRMAGNVK